MAGTIQETGKSGLVYRGVTVDGQRNGMVLERCTKVLVEDCRFLNCGSGGVWFIDCDDVTFRRCVVDGAGSFAHHGDDCLVGVGMGKLLVEECLFARGGHSGLLLKRSDGRQAERVIRNNRFERMGGSLITLKEGYHGARIEGNRLTGAPKLAQAPAVHKVPHAAMQLSGHDHQVIGNVVWDCGIGFLISSSAEQPTNGCLIENNVLIDCEQSLIELQGAGGDGTLNKNVFRGNKLAKCRQLWHIALPNAGADLWGNRFEKNGHIEGPIVIYGSSIATPEQANQRYPQAWKGNYMLDKVPDVSQPPDPGPDPTDPPPSGEPRLDRITPNPARVGETVTLEGANMRGAGETHVILAGTRVSPTEVAADGARLKAKVTGSPRKGDAYARRVDPGVPQRITNKLPFEVRAAGGTDPEPPTPTKIALKPEQITATPAPPARLTVAELVNGKRIAAGDAYSYYVGDLRNSQGQPVDHSLVVALARPTTVGAVVLAVKDGESGRVYRVSVATKATASGSWSTVVDKQLTRAGQEETRFGWTPKSAAAVRVLIHGELDGPVHAEVEELEVWSA